MRFAILLLLTIAGCEASTVQVLNLSGTNVIATADVRYVVPPGQYCFEATGAVQFAVDTNTVGTLDLSVADTTLKDKFAVVVSSGSMSVTQTFTDAGWFAWGFGVGFAWMGTGWTFRLVRRVAHTSPEI